MTLPTVELLPVTRLFQRCLDDEELRDQLFGKGSGYLLYHVLDDLFDYCFPILDKIGHKLDRFEDEMFEGRSEEIVRDISNVKQEIISYRKIIKPERSTLRVLERHTERFLPENLELYYDDIVDAAERIWDLLDNYKEVVEALEDTNESVISHRQNDVLRVLTIFSVVLLPLTLITGLFGMNVRFPGFESAAAFWGIVAAMVIAARRPDRLLPVQAMALRIGVIAAAALVLASTAAAAPVRTKTAHLGAVRATITWQPVRFNIEAKRVHLAISRRGRTLVDRKLGPAVPWALKVRDLDGNGEAGGDRRLLHGRRALLPLHPDLPLHRLALRPVAPRVGRSLLRPARPERRPDCPSSSARTTGSHTPSPRTPDRPCPSRPGATAPGT